MGAGPALLYGLCTASFLSYGSCVVFRSAPVFQKSCDTACTPYVSVRDACMVWDMDRGYTDLGYSSALTPGGPTLCFTATGGTNPNMTCLCAEHADDWRTLPLTAGNGTDCTSACSSDGDSRSLNWAYSNLVEINPTNVSQEARALCNISTFTWGIHYEFQVRQYVSGASLAGAVLQSWNGNSNCYVAGLQGPNSSLLVIPYDNSTACLCVREQSPQEALYAQADDLANKGYTTGPLPDLSRSHQSPIPGAAIGGAIGGAAGAFLIVCLAIWLVRRQRRINNKDPGGTVMPMPPAIPPPSPAGPHLPIGAEFSREAATEIFGRIDVVILVVTETELKACLHQFGHTGWSSFPLGNGGLWARITRLDSADRYVVAVISSSMAEGNSQNAAADVLNILDPRTVVSVGILWGAGLSGQQLGDVVISDRICPVYANTKKVEHQPGRERESPALASTALRKSFGDLTMQQWVWIGPDGEQLPASTEPNIWMGDVISVGILLRDMKKKRKLLGYYPAALGGDMEGWGFAKAADNHPRFKQWIVIKGICDWGDKNKCDDWQPYAAAAAANLVHRFLLRPDALSGL